MNLEPLNHQTDIRGFTFLEVMTAVLILCIVMAALYKAYTSNVETIQLGRGTSQTFQTARIVLDLMRKDLEAAFVPVTVARWRLGLIGKDSTVGGRAADRIDLTTASKIAAQSDPVRTDLCEVGYHVESDPAGNGFILYRREDVTLDMDFTEGGPIEELARGVMEFEIQYENPQGEERNDWSTLEGTQQNMLPTLIKVRLTLSNPSGGEDTFTMIVHPELAKKKGEK